MKQGVTAAPLDGAVVVEVTVVVDLDGLTWVRMARGKVLTARRCPTTPASPAVVGKMDR